MPLSQPDEHLTPEEHRRQIAQILAVGLVRFRRRIPAERPHSGPQSALLESDPAGLDGSGGIRLSVLTGAAGYAPGDQERPMPKLRDPPPPHGSDGTLWLAIGTDSGFEGRTRIFYDGLRVSVAPTAD